MTVMFYQTVEGVQSKTDQAWIQVASKTGPLRVTGNFLQLYAEYGGINVQKAKEVGIRVLVNGVEKGYDHFQPTLDGEYRAFSVFGIIEPTVEEDYTISLEVRTFGSSQTVNVRRVRLMAMQV